MGQMQRITGVAVACAMIGVSVRADDAQKIEGKWKIASVELAGMPVPGIEGAELVLADGKKVFTRLDKRVEKGTYRIDATKRPREIDSTTDGRDGTEKGIYEIDGDTLKLCLATQGTAASYNQKSTDLILIVIVVTGDARRQTRT